MRVVCDVHISRKVADFFTTSGIEALHVNDILDGDRTKDADIAQFAAEGEWVLISKDKDFRDSYLLKKMPPRLLKIELGNLSTSRMIGLLELNLSRLVKEFDRPPCMIELAPGSYRIYH